ncbi:MAG: EAL domain-containing protein [Acholeplasmatales bacterium]|nr:EAL domain-containing protein [Acholeplasmatales bacterium]
MDEKIINDFISIKESFTAIINLKEKQVDELYFDNKLDSSNLSYQEYADAVCNRMEFTEQTGGKLFRFLTNFNTDEEVFSIQMTCQYKSMVNAVFIVIGNLLEDGRYLLSIRKNKRNINKKYDNLTKLFTFDHFKKHLQRDIEQNKKMLVMLINIDEFKKINDLYGFMFGDIVLIESGSSIKSVIGTNGYVGRISADEFIVYKYLDKTDEETLLKECATVRNSITKTSKGNSKQAKITGTMGAVVFPDQAKTLDEILTKANKALTRGKAKGRNCFVIYSQICENKIYDKKIIPSETIMASSATNEGTIVTGVFEMLNHGGDIKRNLYECFKLIGTFFRLDRISLFYDTENYTTLSTPTYIEWINPYRPELEGLVGKSMQKSNYQMIRKEFKNVITLGTLKISQIESNKNLGPVYESLKETKTSAIFLNELGYMGETFGVIRYENTEKNRFWNLNDTSTLLIISKIISMSIYKEAEKKILENLVKYDKLTGLFNYSTWRDSVEDFIATTENYPNYSIVTMNILAYNSIVNRYGANLGDSVLTSIALALNKEAFEGNIYCRISDDNFLLFIANKSNDEIVTIIKNIQSFIDNKYKKISIRLLAGIYIHNGIESVNTCLDYSNIALKNANANNQIVFFSDEISTKEKHKAEIELHMKDALDKNEFLLYLQPKVNTITGDIVGAEALTRWNYNFQKILYPNDFIPIFEETGFITELDYKVFENVCMFQRKCIDEGYKPIKISVNVSRYQKDFSSYLENLNKIRAKYNIDAKYLELEITESMYNENVESIIEFIDALHKDGYYVSMDDFGSGYSNLASLAKLDFDIIKLDKTFCSNINNSKEQTILSFVMKLVKDLDIDVLCEGVETKEFIDNLKQLGCFIVQGYYYSKPILHEEFLTKYIAKTRTKKARID